MPQGLSPAQARRFYDRFGARQDAQAFYEDKATDLLLARSGFEQARNVFELGCGTGRFARKLLEDYLPPQARYSGVDLSPVMVRLAAERLKPWAERAEVRLVEAGDRLPVPAGCDRFVATYVFDLLAPDAIESILDQAHRSLEPEGRLCLTGLTCGRGFPDRWVMKLWEQVYRRRPAWVGGCRPLEMATYLPAGRWTILFRQVVSAWGISSEALVAAPIKS